MDDPISISRLSIAFLPVLIVVALLFAWRGGWLTSCWALSRMLVQLLAVGYVLAMIFNATSPLVVLPVLLLMVIAASWISLRTMPHQRTRLIWASGISILLAGGGVLAVTTAGVLNLKPWWKPQVMIPLAGMIFANCMNAISLAGDRYFAELELKQNKTTSRRRALEAALIPTTNSLFAVGLVSIPGMMTGQVLSGVEPYIAARAQIMVMCMVYASAGLSAAIFLSLLKRFDDLADSHDNCSEPRS